MTTSRASYLRPLAMVGLVSAVCLLLAVPSVAQPPRIAVVDLDFVVAQSPLGKTLQGKLEQFQQGARTEIEAKLSAADDIRRRMTEGVNSLSEDRLGQMQQEYEDAQLAVQRLQDDKQREGQKLQADGLRDIEKQLGPIFEAIREEGGYDLILNRVPGVVVMSSDRVDITQQVVDRLSQAAAATPAP